MIFAKYPYSNAIYYVSCVVRKKERPTGKATTVREYLHSWKANYINPAILGSGNRSDLDLCWCSFRLFGNINDGACNSSWFHYPTRPSRLVALSNKPSNTAQSSMVRDIRSALPTLIAGSPTRFSRSTSYPDLSVLGSGANATSAHHAPYHAPATPGHTYQSPLAPTHRYQSSPTPIQHRHASPLPAHSNYNSPAPVHQ